VSIIPQSIEAGSNEYPAPVNGRWHNAGKKVPLISFVVINYNYGLYLRACVESIYNQDYPRIECVVVDNASTDDSIEVLESLAHDYKSLKVLRNNENIGQCAAFREGFSLTSGAYISIIDADDYLLPAFAATHIRVHLTLPSAFGFTSADMVQVLDETVVLGTYFEAFATRPAQASRAPKIDFLHNIRDLSPALGTDGFESDDFSAKIRIIKKNVTNWIWSPTSGSVYRRDAIGLYIDNPKLEELRFQADSYFNYGINVLTGSVIIEKPLSAYRIHSKNNFTNMVHLKDLLNFPKGKEDSSVAAFFALEHIALNFERFFDRSGNISQLWYAMYVLHKKATTKKLVWIERILARVVRSYFVHLITRARTRTKPKHV